MKRSSLDKNARLSVQLYVKGSVELEEEDSEVFSNWQACSDKLKASMSELFKTLREG